MPKFVYQAIDSTGTVVSGTIEGDSINYANMVLSQRGLIPSSVELDKGSGASVIGWIRDRLTPIRIQDQIMFTRQLRTMLNAGVPILRTLEVLESQTLNPKLKRITAAVASQIKEGSSLSESLARYPAVFPNLYTSMIAAGEASGSLTEILSRLIYMMDHEHKIKTDIKSALQYPMMVLIALGVAFFVLLTFVIPKFVTIFTRAGIALPLPTKICMLMYTAISKYWFITFGLVFALIVVLVLFLKTYRGQYLKDLILLKMPILGPLLVKSIMARFASIFSILQSSGVPIISAIQILSGTIGNTVIVNQFEKLKDKVEQGAGISGPLSTAKFFTPMVVQMIAIGEESGQLDEMLGEVSRHYDDEVNHAVKQMSDSIGPILVVGLAAVVGFFALAIFLPMWDLTQMVKT
jgi:type IV pilus assembly protein PilC